jgi:hypothetical protein
MERSRQLGNMLMAGSAFAALVMLIGVLRRSYLVLALPVLAATGIITALMFWVGWTMANTDDDMAELEAQESVPAAV